MAMEMDICARDCSWDFQLVRPIATDELIKNVIYILQHFQPCMTVDIEGLAILAQNGVLNKELECGSFYFLFCLYIVKGRWGSWAPPKPPLFCCCASFLLLDWSNFHVLIGK